MSNLSLNGTGKLKQDLPLTVRQAAFLTGLSSTKLYEMARSGAIEAVQTSYRYGTRNEIPLRAVEALVGPLTAKDLADARNFEKARYAAENGKRRLAKQRGIQAHKIPGSPEAKERGRILLAGKRKKLLPWWKRWLRALAA